MISYEIIFNPAAIDVLAGKESRFANLHYKYDQETIDMLKKYFQRPDSLYMLAKDADTFVGFCSVDSDWWEPGHFFLREIFVMPEHQGQRIGETLMRRAIQHARDHSAQGIVTETAFENLPMRKLCEKCGFTEWNNPEWKHGITYKITFSMAGLHHPHKKHK